MQNHEQLLSEANRVLSGSQHLGRRDPYRLAYHITAPSGWMNDPNGMIFFRGEYHLFYQLYPFAPENGPKYWGHVKSKDLARWEHLPVALAPSEPYDAGGCWSGTAVEQAGKMVLFYTGVDDHTKEVPVQTVNIAESSDGIRYQKHPANPVLSVPPSEGSAHFRDPKVWNHDGTWYMALGTTRDERGKLALYRSADLIRWTYLGIAAESDGTQGFMWECPDLFCLREKHVLVLSPMGVAGEHNAKAVGVVGHFDYSTGRFVQEHTRVLDVGPSLYAPQTLVDDQGRRILIGWMEKWGASMPTKQFGWAGAMSIPRVVSLLPDNTISLQPAPELTRLRREHRRWEEMTIEPGPDHVVHGLKGDTLEIIAVFDLSACSAGRFGIKVRCAEDGHEGTVVAYTRSGSRLEVDRDLSGSGDGGTHGGLLALSGTDQLHLRLFLDRSSLEVFGNDGRVNITQRIYPSPSSLGIGLFSEGGSVRLISLDAWKL